MPRRHLLLATLVALAALVLPAASASAATSPRKLRMDVTVSNFVVTKAGLKALGSGVGLAGRQRRPQEGHAERQARRLVLDPHAASRAAPAQAARAQPRHQRDQP